MPGIDTSKQTLSVSPLRPAGEDPPVLGRTFLRGSRAEQDRHAGGSKERQTTGGRFCREGLGTTPGCSPSLREPPRSERVSWERPQKERRTLPAVEKAVGTAAGGS